MRRQEVALVWRESRRAKMVVEVIVFRRDDLLQFLIEAVGENWGCA